MKAIKGDPDKKRDRLKRKKDRLESDIKEIKGGEGKVDKTTTKGVDFNAGSGCTKNVKGSCEDGTLKAMKSKPSKGMEFREKKSGLLNVSGADKYRKIARKTKRLAKVDEKLKENRKPSTKYTNPRFL